MALSTDCEKPVPPGGDGDALKPALSWIPIRSLAPRHRPRIVAHLQALPAHDRYLRFGQATVDTQIGRYVDLIEFERDEVFGIFNRRLELVAMAHLAYLPHSAGLPAAAEFGVSVAPAVRRRGFGARLFEHAVLHARNRHIDTVVIHALSENAAMLHIVRAAGATIEHDGPELEARLRLPADDAPESLDALVEQPGMDDRNRIERHRPLVDVQTIVPASAPQRLRKD